MVLYGGAERGSGGSGFFSSLKFVWDMGLVIPIFLMMRSKSLIGVNMLRISEHHPELIAQCIRELVDAQAQGWLKPHVHELFAADRLPEAHALLESGRSIGKVALKW